jgi:hypothetical protein
MGSKCRALSHFLWPSDHQQTQLLTEQNCSTAAYTCILQAVSEAGIDYDEAHVPLLLHAAYGDWPFKMIVMLRNPIERLWTAFHEYGQYKGKYGATPEVLSPLLTGKF